jgi:pescadillo protein
VGHERSVEQVSDVDFAVMANFVEFYITMLSFVNFRLFKSIGLFYPPQLQTTKALQPTDETQDVTEDVLDKVYSLARPLARSQEAEPEATVDTFSSNDDGESLAGKLQQLQTLRSLFTKCRFFLNREIPMEPLTFVIRSCGGVVSWEGCPASIYDEGSDSITHHVIDRPMDKTNLNRIYIQPQWIFDCFNARKLLATQRYAPGAVLPPHLSPFVEENIGDYVSFENIEEMKKSGKDISPLLTATEETSKPKQKKSAKEAAKQKEMRVEAGRTYKENPQRKINEEGHNLKLKEMLIAKKYRRAYKKIKFGMKREKRETRKLEEKRQKLSSQ